MFRRIDESRTLGRLIEWLSATLARQRGLLVVLGIFLVLVSFIVGLLNSYAHSQALELIWVIAHHLGIIIALIGLLLVEPLGK